MRNIIWTEEKKQYIINNYGIKETHVLAIEMNTSKAMINSIASSSGVRKRHWLWSPEEVSFLENNFSKINIEDLQKVINRSKGTIINRACKLGLRRKYKKVIK